MPSECPCSVSFDLRMNVCLEVARYRAVSLAAGDLACELHALPNEVTVNAFHLNDCTSFRLKLKSYHHS